MHKTETISRPRPGHNVLMVEDEPGDVALIRLYLQEKDADAFSLDVVGSLSEAICSLDQRQSLPDVILLDLNLPDSEGLVTLLRLREKSMDIPIVVLTGMDDTRWIQEALKSGAQDYLVKGADGRSLRKALRYAIVRHERDQTARLSEAVFNITNTGIMMLDRQFFIRQYNPAFLRLTGMHESMAVGRTPHSLPCEFQALRSWDMLLEELQDKGACADELSCRKPGSMDCVLAMRAHAVYTSDGYISGYVMVFEDITARKKAQEALAYQATHDGLTGLPNRTLFYDRLNQALTAAERYGTAFALMYIDLDAFKPVNDTLGHAAGDQVLVEVARRIQSAVRQSDTVARLSGDEFAVIAGYCDDAEKAVGIAEKIQQTLQLPISLPQGTVHISASIGISRCPDDAYEAHYLVKTADEAMYQAKRQGKLGICLYR
ncbi:diguanylate cyclase domain-containing protein [Nitrincola sp.]|uniref:diguanylate cyclase domain-containing protein n=1 Tax=Nitrincola sp. TaxID=1926584 RepID=UPI003A8FC53B